jgi:serine/threonine-protein kinase
MGEVYEVEHVRLKCLFALKLLRAELLGERELVARFEREARDVAALHSEHIVRIVDSGALSDGRPYFVMERLVGQDLKQVLAGTAELPVARAVNLGIDICLGLHAAHSAGLVHRDLKPENVFVIRGDDEKERCKLLDFGVAKLMEEDQTRPGALVGTARYMAPEQVKTGEQVTPAADLFALGVVLYRCLSGQHPFAADNLERVLFRVLNETPAPLPAHVPSGLAQLIEQAMAKQPSERPSSALAFARGLARFSPEPRNLEGIGTWHVDTVVADPTSSDGVTSTDTTPVGGPETSKPVAPARRVMPLLGAAVLLVLATLGAERLLFGTRSGAPSKEGRQPAHAAVSSSLGALPPTLPPPAASPSVMRAPDPPTPPIARQARPAQKSVAPNAATKPPEAAPSAAKPETSAAPSLNWFDPRNPYGR